jgi:DNA-binding MarR family transcriptional regulator
MGIGLVQWSALQEVDRNPATSMHRLAERSFNSDHVRHADGTSIAHWIDRKVSGPGRVTHHQLTPQGADLLRKGCKLVMKVLALSFAPLEEDERDTLRKTPHQPIAKPATNQLPAATSLKSEVKFRQRQLTVYPSAALARR